MLQILGCGARVASSRVGLERLLVAVWQGRGRCGGGSSGVAVGVAVETLSGAAAAVVATAGGCGGGSQWWRQRCQWWSGGGIAAVVRTFITNGGRDIAKLTN